LFESRERIPDESEFPNVKPCLDSYEFPNHILTEQRLNEVLKKERIDAIRRALLNMNKDCNEDKIQINYRVPWDNLKIIKKGSVDMIFSQGALGYIIDLESAYKALDYWLKSGGFVSHLIPFCSIGSTKQWNGHWAYSDFIWKLIKGKRDITLNRQPHSSYTNLFQQFNYEIICDIKVKENLCHQNSHTIKQY